MYPKPFPCDYFLTGVHILRTDVLTVRKLLFQTPRYPLTPFFKYLFFFFYFQGTVIARVLDERVFILVVPPVARSQKTNQRGCELEVAAGLIARSGSVHVTKNSGSSKLPTILASRVIRYVYSNWIAGRGGSSRGGTQHHFYFLHTCIILIYWNA